MHDERSARGSLSPISGDDRALTDGLSRRDALKGLSMFAAALASARSTRAERFTLGDDTARSSLTFTEVARGNGVDLAVAPGYDARVLLSWGDPVLEGAPIFAPGKAGYDAQSKQLGFNNDFLAFLPLPRATAGAKDEPSSDHGLLCINHEYTWIHMMVPGLTIDGALTAMTREHFELEQAAHGHSVVEIEKHEGRWRVCESRALNRRITARTGCRVSGPAAGHERLKTSADPSGAAVVGTLNNCAGGVTPWGTVLVCEENFHKYFHGATDDAREKRNHERYNVGGELEFAWYRFDERFEVSKEPREANRFGWVVEFDPYDPASSPVKRTALGRLKHESATCTLSHDGRVVVYTGDDEKFEHLYKFVSARPWKAGERNLLDEGTLHAARFDADGTLSWLPLVHGQGPLTKENGFDSQADVLIEARRAADLVGATQLDRPEDVEVSPRTGKVYAMLTNNSSRKEDQIGPATPRAKNRHGHVLEIVPPSLGGKPDHANARATWSVLLLGGDPRDKKSGARSHAGTSVNGWLTCPDNGAFDPQGRLWITTDGGPKSGFCDAIYACDVEGDARALTRAFLRGPIGCEMTGPCFTPDGKTLFVSVQHPGETDEKDDPKPCSFATPSTRWPDFIDGVPPRPSVLAITKEDGGVIGG